MLALAKPCAKVHCPLLHLFLYMALQRITSPRIRGTLLLLCLVIVIGLFASRYKRLQKDKVLDFKTWKAQCDRLPRYHQEEEHTSVTAISPTLYAQASDAYLIRSSLLQE